MRFLGKKLYKSIFSVHRIFCYLLQSGLKQHNMSTVHTCSPSTSRSRLPSSNPNPLHVSTIIFPLTQVTSVFHWLCLCQPLAAALHLFNSPLLFRQSSYRQSLPISGYLLTFYIILQLFLQFHGLNSFQNEKSRE